METKKRRAILGRIGRKHLGVALVLLLGGVLIWHVTAVALSKQLKQAYADEQSSMIYDRNGALLLMAANEQGNYDQFMKAIPSHIARATIEQEDKFFYFHFGLNPISMVEDGIHRLWYGQPRGSSTIAQQLTKILLQNVQRRTWNNKFKESFYTLALEWTTPKQEILTMYLNSAYFGNQTQGLEEASRTYFRLPPENLNETQWLSLLATLNSPSQNQPGTFTNKQRAEALARRLGLTYRDEDLRLASDRDQGSWRTGEAAFEVQSLHPTCPGSCQMTLDQDLTVKIRDIMKRHLYAESATAAANAAVVVMKLPENELLSVVGSPSPSTATNGMQINMALYPRAVGSTAKPFIYLKAFEKGARPYTLVDDREYQYQIGNGFNFYPKNFDGQFHGIVTLHQALSNSLNIPSVKVLEFAGIEAFYKFLDTTLGFRSTQSLENYELGIALGGLESDLLTWSHYFTIFPNGGVLKPLTLFQSGSAAGPYLTPPMEAPMLQPKKVGHPAEIELVNKILSDRDTGVAQFGIKSNLNLPFRNYAVKTGTSRDYHDSWTMGFTPDFLVGVWVGNSNDTPLHAVTGQTGAGKIWADVMLLLYNSSYNHNTPFHFDDVKEFADAGSLDYGLEGDEYPRQRMLMLEPTLLLSPHDSDEYLYQKTMSIPLRASSVVDWSVNGTAVAHGASTEFIPPHPGIYVVRAMATDGKDEQATIHVNAQESP